jgi:hypothetical protein
MIRKLRRILFLNFLFFLMIISISIFMQLKSNLIKFSHEHFNEYNKCPYCYGEDLCYEFQEHKNHQYNKFDFIFERNDLTNLYSTSILFNIKNVYFVYDSISKKRLVFKKLAHNSELKNFDSDENGLKFWLSSNSTILQKRLSYENFNDVSRKFQIDIASCMSKSLINKIYSFGNSIDNYTNENIMLLTTMTINPEPIVLKVILNKIIFQ